MFAFTWISKSCWEHKKELLVLFSLWFTQEKAHSKIRFTSRLRFPVTWQVGLLPDMAVYRHSLTFWNACSHTAVNFSLQLTLHLGNNSERSKNHLTPAASTSLKSRLFHVKQSTNESEELVFWEGAVSLTPCRKEGGKQVADFPPSSQFLQTSAKKQLQISVTLKVPGVKSQHQHWQSH